MKKFLRDCSLFVFIAFSLLLGVAFSQQTSGIYGQALAPAPSWNTPDCILTFRFTATGRSQALDNRLTGCSTWHLVYYSNGWTTVSLAPQQAPDSNGSAGGWSNWPAAQSQGTLPLTSTTFTQISFFSFAPWVAVNTSTLSGGSNQSLQGVLLGWRAQGATESSNGAQVAQGAAAEGTASVGNPVPVGGRFESTPTVLTNGQQGVLQQDANQNLKVVIQNTPIGVNAGISYVAAGTGSNPTSVAPGAAIQSVSDQTGNGFVRTGGPNQVNCYARLVANALADFTQNAGSAGCGTVTAAGLKLYITDITVGSSTATATAFRLSYGTGAACVTTNTALYPASTSDTWTGPANTAAPLQITFNQPLVVPATNRLCVIGIATNTANISVNGFIAP